MPDMTKDKRRDELREIPIIKTGLTRIEQDILIDQLLAREKKMLEEIERPLKDAQSSYHLSTDILASASIAISGIDYALATINKYKG